MGSIVILPIASAFRFGETNVFIFQTSPEQELSV